MRPLGSYVDHWDARHQHKRERATWHFLGRIPYSLHSGFAYDKGLQSFGSSCFWAFHCFAMDSKELSSISDCFSDKKAIKTPKLNTIWLELIARVLNMLIGLKCGNYYSKVFKRVNYKLWNSTFWVVIRYKMNSSCSDTLLFAAHKWSMPKPSLDPEPKGASKFSIYSILHHACPNPSPASNIEHWKLQQLEEWDGNAFWRKWRGCQVKGKARIFPFPKSGSS